MQQKSDQIRICAEAGSNVPVVVGNCPHCGLGNRSLILMNFAMNGINPQYSKIYFTCVGCSKLTEKNFIDIVEDD